MTRVLITGAGGYIGSNAVEYFLKHGFEVTGMVHRRIAPRFIGTGATAIQADLNDIASLERLFAEPVDYVLHIAALASDTGRERRFRTAN